MAYQVALLNFEGPLDLLLQLIERSDLEITQISLSEVTSQYLSYLDQLPALSPQELNQFLELATRLIYLKSVALLPGESTEELDEGLSQLAEQLEQYRHYQKATLYLEQILKTPAHSWPRNVAVSLPVDKLPLPTVSLSNLEEAFSAAIAKLAPVSTVTAGVQSISLVEMTSRLIAWIESQPASPSLKQFLATLASRNELVVAFIGILELVRTRVLDVSQGGVFDDIILLKA